MHLVVCLWVRYQGKIPILPWSETAPQDETRFISHSLAKINRAGFLTINSQPVRIIPANSLTDEVF